MVFIFSFLPAEERKKCSIFSEIKDKLIQIEQHPGKLRLRPCFHKPAVDS